MNKKAVKQQEEERLKGKTCYFIMETERDEQGNFIPCIAKEGESGFWRTDWQWGKDKALAQECADDMNEKLGLTKTQAMIIQLRSMRTS